MNSPPWKGQEGCSAKAVVRIYTEREQPKFTIFFLLLALIILAVAARRWGANSSDGVNSSEWQQRQQWYGFH